MATPATQAAAPAKRGGDENATFNKIMKIGQQVALMYLISLIVGKVFTKPPTTTIVPGDGVAVPQTGPYSPEGIPDPFSLAPVSYAPLWTIGSTLDMHVHVSPHGHNPFTPATFGSDKDLPSFTWKDITYGDWKDERVNDFVVDVPVSVQHNSSLWLHVTLTNNHAEPNPFKEGYDPNQVYHFRKPLTRYLKKPKAHVERNLLSKGDELEKEKEQEPEADVWLSYWHPNVTLTIVSDPALIQASQVIGPIAKYLAPHPQKRDQTGKVGFYYPIVFPNDFWLLRGNMNPINTTTPTLPLRISYHAISQTKFHMYSTFTQGFDEAASKGSTTSADLDEIKRMLIETNPWLLITTLIVSLLHMLFEMLAFTSDVAHWRKKDQFVGVSVRSIVVNVVVQAITALYLFDNAEETSWMILLTQAMGVAIEAWKITKAVNIAIVPSAPGATLPYKLLITDKHVLNEDEKKTQEFDALAFRYVSYVAIPVLAAYTGYSLIYNTHKSWYSFILSTLTSFVYMFGFVQLVPQLIINYKLKSVAHMPWKTMMYKTLSTVVDDFFSFIIKMPWLHRLACFRDDVVFLILLYQRWIYRIDYKRVNEYGQVADTPDEDDAKKVAGADKKE